MFVLEGRAFLRGSLERVAIGIEEGRIVRIAKVLQGEDHRDVGDRLILPGAVDLHVHFRDPGHTHAEDFHSGTVAAAVGGVTTVFDMPNTDPPVLTPDALREKHRNVAGKANVDFGLVPSIRSGDDVRAFANLARLGKVFMAASTGSALVASPTRWEEIVAAAHASGLRVAFHAEHPAGIGEGGDSLRGHGKARPPEAEGEAIAALGRTAPHGAESPVHVAHVSSSRGVAALSGTSFTSEVTPHHLFLDAGRKLGAFGKVNPPLRGPDDRMALWQALLSGRISCVASDHAPRTIEEKGEEFEAAPPGVPGVETMLPLMLRHVKSGDLPLGRFVEVTSLRPASIVGVPAGIDVGLPANLIVVDPRAVVAIRARDLHSRCGWTPFEGFEAVFPTSTYLHGHLVADDRELTLDHQGRDLGPTTKRS